MHKPTSFNSIYVCQIVISLGAIVHGAIKSSYPTKVNIYKLIPQQNIIVKLMLANTNKL